MDGWNTSFLLGWPIFRGELLVSGRVIQVIFDDKSQESVVVYKAGFNAIFAIFAFPQTFPSPSKLSDFLFLIKVIAGGLHTCAILVDNSTKCWGWGFYGQLGSGATDNIGDEPNELLGRNLSFLKLPLHRVFQPETGTVKL